MYYEEKCENGHWLWRGTPNGAWLAFTTEMLEKKVSRFNALQRALLQIRESTTCTGCSNHSCPHCVAEAALAS